jgi:ClpX C4-type zinc finger
MQIADNSQYGGRVVAGDAAICDGCVDVAREIIAAKIAERDQPTPPSGFLGRSPTPP